MRVCNVVWAEDNTHLGADIMIRDLLHHLKRHSEEIHCLERSERRNAFPLISFNHDGDASRAET